MIKQAVRKTVGNEHNLWKVEVAKKSRDFPSLQNGYTVAGSKTRDELTASDSKKCYV